MDRYFINKSEFFSIISKSTMNITHILAPMGSGKTTSIKSYLKANIDKQYVILSPYRIVKSEYSDMSNATHKYIIEVVLKAIDSINSSNATYTQEAFINEIYSILDIYNINGIFLDEADFVWTQSNANDISNRLVFKHVDGENIYTLKHMLNIFFYSLTLVDIFKVSISANKLEVDGDFVDIIKLNLKSRINIKGIYIVTVKSHHYARDCIRFTTTLTGKRLHFKSNKYGKEQLSLLRNSGASIVIRTDNLVYEFNNKTKRFETKLDGYDKLFPIGYVSRYNDMTIDNLSDLVFKASNLVAINTSSSRCVSLNNRDNSSIIIEMGNTKYLTSTMLQVLGRFRVAPINIYLLVNESISIDIYKLLSKAKSIDTFIFKDITIDDFRFMTSKDKTSYKAIEYEYDNNLSLPENYNRYIKTVSSPVSKSTFYRRLKGTTKAELTVEWINTHYNNKKSLNWNYKRYSIKVGSPINIKKFRELIHSLKD